MSTSGILRKTIKAVAEHICDTPGSAPDLTASLLQLVETTVRHESNLQVNSAEALASIEELKRQVRELRERCNLLDSVTNVKRLEVRA